MLVFGRFRAWRCHSHRLSLTLLLHDEVDLEPALLIGWFAGLAFDIARFADWLLAAGHHSHNENLPGLTLPPPRPRQGESVD